MTRPFTLPIYRTEVGTPSLPRHLDTAIQTDKFYRTVDLDNDDEVGNAFVGDCVLAADEEIAFAQFGETHYGRIATCYLSQYVRGDRSIDTVNGIRRQTNGTSMTGDSPLLLHENIDFTLLGAS